MNLPDSGFDKTLVEIKAKRASKMMEEKPSREPLTKEESEAIREMFREYARSLVVTIDGASHTPQTK